MADPRHRSKDHSPHVTDERFNTVSHTVGAILATLGSAVLIARAGTTADPWAVTSFSIYGVSLILLFVISALHHGVDGSEVVERRLRTLDYAAVFLLVAGSLTPLCLVLARGILGWSVFGVAWTVAVFGIALRATRPTTPKWFTNTLYLTTGLLAAALAMPVWQQAGLKGLVLLAAGGSCFVLGIVIYIVEKPNPLPGRFGFHEIWHLFVMAGAGCHYLFMYRFVLPGPGGGG